MAAEAASEAAVEGGVDDDTSAPLSAEEAELKRTVAVFIRQLIVLEDLLLARTDDVLETYTLQKAAESLPPVFARTEHGVFLAPRFWKKRYSQVLTYGWTVDTVVRAGRGDAVSMCSCGRKKEVWWWRRWWRRRWRS